MLVNSTHTFLDYEIALVGFFFQLMLHNDRIAPFFEI